MSVLASCRRERAVDNGTDNGTKAQVLPVLVRACRKPAVGNPLEGRLASTAEPVRPRLLDRGPKPGRPVACQRVRHVDTPPALVAVAYSPTVSL